MSFPTHQHPHHQLLQSRSLTPVVLNPAAAGQQLHQTRSLLVKRQSLIDILGGGDSNMSDTPASLSREVTGPGTSSNTTPTVGDPESGAASKSGPSAATTTGTPRSDSTTTANGASTNTPTATSPTTTTTTGSTTDSSKTGSTANNSNNPNTNSNSNSKNGGSTSDTSNSPSSGLGSIVPITSNQGTTSSPNSGSATGTTTTTNNNNSGTSSSTTDPLKVSLPFTIPSTNSSTAAKTNSTPTVNAPATTTTTTARTGANAAAGSFTPVFASNGSAQPVFTSTPVSPGAARNQASAQSSGQDGTGTSVGTIMGILVAALIGAVILAGLVGKLLKRRKRRANEALDFHHPFGEQPPYGAEPEMSNINSDDAHGAMPHQKGSPHCLSPSGSFRNQSGYGPRPPSILEQHCAASQPQPPMPSFQPGQVVNYNHQVPPQFHPNRPQPPPLLPYPTNTNLAYASDAMMGSQANGADYGMHQAQYYDNKPTDLKHRPSEVSRSAYADAGSNFEPSHYHAPLREDQGEGLAYSHQVQQMDFGPPLGQPRSHAVQSLKNPYDNEPAAPTIDRSGTGTPTNPNLQQSYFAHRHTDSGNMTPNLAQPSHELADYSSPYPAQKTAPDQYAHAGALDVPMIPRQRTLSVQNATGTDDHQF